MPLTDDLQGLAQRLVEPLRAWFSPATVAGAFTPTLAGTGTAGTFTYDRQEGRSWRIGPLAYVAARCRISAITVAATGNLRMLGLPFASASATDILAWPIAADAVNLIDMAAGTVQVTARVIQAQSYIEFAEAKDNAAATLVSAALLVVGSDIVIGGWYPLG